MPDTSNKALNAHSPADVTVPPADLPGASDRGHHGTSPTGAVHNGGDQGSEAPRGHAAENAQAFTPSMEMPGAGTPDGPADDGSPGGPTASNLGADGKYQDAPAPTTEQIEDAALGGRVGR